MGESIMLGLAAMKWARVLYAGLESPNRKVGRLRLLVVRVFLNRVANLHDALEVVASLFDLLRIDSARFFDDGISYEVLDLLAKQDQLTFDPCDFRIRCPLLTFG